MPPMRLFPPLAVLGAVLAPGCTLVVIDDIVDDQVVCQQPGDCAAGFACADGACREADTTGLPPPEGTVVGPSGGDVFGPDGVALAVPTGALATDTALVIVRESATNIARGCDERSGFYRVTPEVQLATAAVLSIPVVDCAACVVCAAPEDDVDEWQALEPPPVAPSGSAAALVQRTGQLVVAGVAP